MRVNRIPLPGIKANLMKHIYCRDLRPVNIEAVNLFKDYLGEKLYTLGDDVLKHYRESIRIGEILGLGNNIIKSIILFLGLVYQVPTALYNLFINQGYRFRTINPYYCIGYVVDDEVGDEGIYVLEKLDGTFIGYINAEESIHVDPLIINALSDRIVGFSYLVIDDIIGRDIDLGLIRIISRYGEENYHYLCHLLIRRIGEVLDEIVYPNIIVGLRVKEIYKLALKTINIYKNLIPYDRVGKLEG